MRTPTSSLHQYALERVGPGVAQNLNGTIDHRMPLKFDAEGMAAGDLADLVRRHLVLSRSIENGGKRRRLDRNHRAGAAFVEEGEFGRCVAVDFDDCAKRRAAGRGRRGTSLKTSHYRSETGFGEADREAAVGDVVRRLEDAFGSESDETVDQKFFGGETPATMPPIVFEYSLDENSCANEEKRDSSLRSE